MHRGELLAVPVLKAREAGFLELLTTAVVPAKNVADQLGRSVS
jgi:hypothetical protein